MKVRPDPEARCLIVSPPSRQAGQVPRARMSFVDKTFSNASRTSVQIFVVAPDREIGPPVVQPQRYISDVMGQIESDDASLSLPGSGDFFHVERLSGDVVHSPNEDQRNRVAFLFDQRLDILIAQAGFALPGHEFEQRRGWIKTMEADLRLDRILIRGKSSAFDENLVPVGRGT